MGRKEEVESNDKLSLLKVRGSQSVSSFVNFLPM